MIKLQFFFIDSPTNSIYLYFNVRKFFFKTIGDYIYIMCNINHCLNDYVTLIRRKKKLLIAFVVYLTTPLVFFSVCAANICVTPTREIPSTSIIWSFTCILKGKNLKTAHDIHCIKKYCVQSVWDNNVNNDNNDNSVVW